MFPTQNSGMKTTFIKIKKLLFPSAAVHREAKLSVLGTEEGRASNKHERVNKSHRPTIHMSSAC